MKKSNVIKAVLTAAVLLALAVWFFIGMDSLSSGYARQGQQQLEDALRRSAAACYAAEGIYPPNVNYLAEHYGVQWDTERYTVFYEIFADNIMPEITVLEKSHE